jgi:transcriptional regulator with XRE-family HTH domain
MAKKTGKKLGVVLPRSFGDQRIPEHPLLVARRRITRTDLARALGVSSQAIVIWEERCRTNRDYLLPANRIKAIAAVAGLPPYTLRPDVFEDAWDYKSSVLEDLDLLTKRVEPTRGKLAGARG